MIGRVEDNDNIDTTLDIPGIDPSGWPILRLDISLQAGWDIGTPGRDIGFLNTI
jgi:hypothetical protein